MKTFGETLRELLRRHKIKQRQLSEWTELDVSTINRYLADTQKPWVASVEAIAYCYGFTDAERIALFRSARCVPTALIEALIDRFVDDEEFAAECWQKCHKTIQVCMHQRQPRVYS